MKLQTILKKFNKNSETGFTLIEVLVAVFILTTLGAGLLTSLTLISKVIMNTDKQETARDLAVAEMEYLKSLNYNAVHYDYNPALIPPGSNYTVQVLDPPQTLQDGNLQLITVTVSWNGSAITTLSDYKVKWKD